MHVNTLKKIYTTLDKIIQNKWIVSETVTILGHTVTINSEVSIDRDFDIELHYPSLDMDKDATKFFDELYRVFDMELCNTNYVSDLKYDQEDGISKSLTINKLILIERRFLFECFFTTENNLRPFDEVKELYKLKDVEKKVVTVPLSKQYEALIEKGKPVRVGCQNIPIDIVRQIITEYDKL